MHTEPLDYHQRDLFALFPGAPGGRAIRDQRGRAYLAKIGAKGGRQTVKNHGIAYMRQLGSSGGREKRRRLYLRPATIRPWYGGRERRVPYWPTSSTRYRRKRPIFVRIELPEVE